MLLDGAMSAGSLSAARARCLADRLVGVPLPSVLLVSFREDPLDLRQLAQERPMVIYLFPGAHRSPTDGEQTPLVDHAQHRAFCEHYADLAARGYGVVGISSQSTQSQKQSALAGHLIQRLFSDRELGLAAELELATFEVDGARWYQRLTLVVKDGRIEKAFFPVASAARSAAQVITWMRVQGI
jgi:peroxiredoxin